MRQVFSLEESAKSESPSRPSPKFSSSVTVISNPEFPTATGPSAVDAIDESSTQEDRVEKQDCEQGGDDRDDYAE